MTKIKTKTKTNKTYLVFMSSVFIILLTFLLYGIFSPLSDAPMQEDLLSPPSKNAWLGTNNLGQDILLKTVLATPNTIITGFGAGLLTLILSIIFAIISIISNKGIEAIMLRILDAFLIIPSIILSMLIASYLLPSTFSLIFLLAILQWSAWVRQIRSILLKEMQRESYKQAKLMGASVFYLTRRHLIPKSKPFFIALFIISVKQSIIHASGLAFLGITDPSKPSWGGILSEALPLFDSATSLWLIAAPALALFLLLLFLTLIGINLEKKY